MGKTSGRRKKDLYPPQAGPIYTFFNILYLLQQILLPYLCSMKIENAIKQSSFANSYHKVLVNLIYTGNWIRDEQSKIFKEFDLLPQHYNVLRIIKGHMPAPIAPKDIKEVLIDKAGDLTRLIDKLEKMGYVRRNLCPSNRRQMDISMTQEGLALLAEIQTPLEKFTDKIEQHLSEQQAAALSDLLDVLRG